MSKYKYPICRGSIALGSACMNCEKCMDEQSEINKKYLGSHTFQNDLSTQLAAANQRIAELKDANQDKAARIITMGSRIAELEAENQKLKKELEYFEGLSDEKNKRIESLLQEKERAERITKEVN